MTVRYGAPDMATIGVSIAVPDPHGATLQRCREQFGDPMAQAIPAHITILPPTEVDGERRGELENHLTWVCEGVAPFEILLRGTGTFRPISPVVFVQLAAGIAQCESLESAVRAGPVRRELDFNYHPHVTVAHNLPEDMLEHAFTTLGLFEARFMASSVHLYEHGADEVWRPVREFEFGLR